MLSLLSFLLIFSAANDTLTVNETNLTYEFIKQDTTLIFSSSFFAQCDSSTLISILYDFDHLQKFIPKDFNIELYEKGDGWYIVRYHFSILIFHLQSDYKRILRGNQVDFEMVSVSKVAPSVPTILSSNGYYRMKKFNDGYMIEYYQLSTTNKTAFNRILEKKVEKRAISFVKNLKEYVLFTCH
ncbi:hypothetical protein JW935_14200 [candidate division KSB1 bacterium]|nr:hypothetical protein [candidate division KSB1 bacterium]